MPKRLTRQELYEQVWAEPLTKLSTKFDVSDVALGKVCKRHAIPRPGLGYWARIAAGKKLVRPALRGNPTDEIEIVGATPRSPAVETALQQVVPIATTIIVPDRLLNPHPLVVQTRSILESKSGWIRQCALNVWVTKPTVPRAMRLINTRIKEVTARGLTLSKTDKDRHARFELGPDWVRFKLREKSKSTTEPEVAAAVGSGKEFLLPAQLAIEPKGTLGFELEEYLDGARKSWSDGKKLLEEQVASIVDGILVAMQIVRARRLAREEQAREWAEQERLRAEAKARVEQELKERRALLAEATMWSEVRVANQYLDHLEVTERTLGRVSSELRLWLFQARRRLAELDPTTVRLGQVVRPKL